MNFGLARTADIAGWGGNTRRIASASTNASQSYTASGAVTSTTQYKFGTASEYVATTTDYIYTSAGTPSYMDFGTGDFCIEMWIYISGTTPGTGRTPSSTSDVMSLDLMGGFGLRLAKDFSNGSLTTSDPKYINIFARSQADLDYWTLPSNWATGQWYFLVIQRKSAVTAAWLDGTLLTKTANGGNTRNFASNGGGGTNIKIGTADGGNGVGPAYIDELCVSNTYRYPNQTANIPVPTAAFTVDAYTTQLMHMDGTNGGTTFTNATS